MDNKKNISIYSKTAGLSYHWTDIMKAANDFNYTIFFAKSYANLNWVLENSDLLIIDDERWAPDIELLYKRFRSRNIPVACYSNCTYLSDDYEKKDSDESDPDKKNLIKRSCKTVLSSDFLITEIPGKMSKVSIPKILIKPSVSERFIDNAKKKETERFNKNKNTILLISNKKNWKEYHKSLQKAFKKQNIKVKLADFEYLNKNSCNEVYCIILDMNTKNSYYDSLYFLPILKNIPLISTNINIKNQWKSAKGILFANNKAEILEDAEKIINDSSFAKSLCKNSLKFLEENWSSKKVTKEFETEINKVLAKIYKQKQPSKRALSFNFSEEMKKNNRKNRLDIFPFLKTDKSIYQHYLINENPSYKEYILKMEYKDLKKAYDESKKNKKPKILERFNQDLMKKSCSPRICKMINNICKDPEYTIDEILFYMIKDVKRNHKIFKDEETLHKYVKEFCDLSYIKDNKGEILFKYLDYEKHGNYIMSFPDTYNIREFLTTAFLEKENYDVLGSVLKLCTENIITKNELAHIVYLLKYGFINAKLLSHVIQKNYIKDGRLNFASIKEKDLNKFIKNKDAKIKDFIKLEKNIKYKPEHFFIKIEGYGKNESWGKRVSALSEHVSDMILQRESCIDVMTEICYQTRQNDMLGRRDKGALKQSAILRCISPENYKGSLVTPYDYKSRYGGQYSHKFKKFKDPKVKLHSPHRDLYLTRIEVKKNDELSGKMLHVPSAASGAAILYTQKIYDKLTLMLNKKLNEKQHKKLIESIAEIHWMLAHNAPWGRGSDSIANIFIKGLLRAFGIKVGAPRKYLSFDLEAFCTELEDYKRNYTKYYTSFKYIF